MLNRVSLIGRLAADPEARQLASGSQVVNFKLAVSEQWKDKQTGERKERTEWVPCVCWNEGLGRVLESYVRKGQLVYVEGAFQTRKWTAQDGTDKYTTEVVLNANGVLRMLGGKSEDRAEDGSGPANPQARFSGGTVYTGRYAPQPQAKTAPPLDDEIPF